MDLSGKVIQHMGLRFWSYSRDSDTFELTDVGDNGRNAPERAPLDEHAIWESVPPHYHDELRYLLTRTDTPQGQEFSFEFELIQDGQPLWVLLIGQPAQDFPGYIGVILPNHKRRQEQMEKQALLKAVNNLILKSELRKRQESMDVYEQKLAKREAELITQTLKASENAQKIDGIVKSLESNQINRTRLIASLRSNNRAEINWEEFKVYFNELHPEFVQSLWKMNATLTEREVKVCILVRLGLQTKDIALLTKLTPKTIEIYRYRIRKKLKLPRSESLLKALSSYKW